MSATSDSPSSLREANGGGLLPLATLAEQECVSYDRVHDMAHTGKLKTVLRPAAVHVTMKLSDGRKVSCTRRCRVMHARRADLQKLLAAGGGHNFTLSLMDAARESGIAYETWYWWGKIDCCPPLGRKLELRRLIGNGEDGRVRKIAHMRPRDYQTVTRTLAATLLERFFDGPDEYLSPTAAAAEFHLPRWRSVPASMGQLRRRKNRRLGHKVRHKKGEYLDDLGRWVSNYCYLREDLARLFRSRGPTPATDPASPPAAPPNGTPPEPATGGTAAAAKPAPARKARRGPNKNPETEKLRGFCRDQIASGKGSKEVARLVRERFSRPNFTAKQARAYASQGRKAQ